MSQPDQQAFRERVSAVLRDILGDSGSTAILFDLGEPDPLTFEAKLTKILGEGAKIIIDEFARRQGLLTPSHKHHWYEGRSTEALDPQGHGALFGGIVPFGSLLGLLVMHEGLKSETRLASSLAQGRPWTSRRSSTRRETRPRYSSPTCTWGSRRRWPRKGFRIPPYSQKMLDRMNSIAEKNRLNRVIVVGDVKHSIGKVEDIDWGIIPWFFDTLLDIFPTVEVVPGNHDGADQVAPARPCEAPPRGGDRDRDAQQGRHRARPLVAFAGGHRVQDHRDGALALSLRDEGQVRREEQGGGLALRALRRRRHASEGRPPSRSRGARASSS